MISPPGDGSRRTDDETSIVGLAEPVLGEHDCVQPRPVGELLVGRGEPPVEAHGHRHPGVPGRAHDPFSGADLWTLDTGASSGGGVTRTLAIADGRAYFAPYTISPTWTRLSKIEVIDLADPAGPRRLGSLSTTGEVRSLALAGQ